jgi:hypothetical protein
MARKRCTPWTKKARGWRRTCGAYTARIVRASRKHMPGYNVSVSYRGHNVDRMVADTLAAAKKFANPRLTGR